MTQVLVGGSRTRGKDSVPAIEWITQVLKSRPEAQVSDFAASAGVSRKTVANLLGPSPRPSLYAGTYERIMSTGPQDLKISRHRIVSGKPARRMVAALVEDGWSHGEIAQAAGLQTSTLTPQNLDRVYVETISRLQRATRTLNNRHAHGERSNATSVPSYPMLRRVEALMVLGWTREEITRRSGVSVAAIRTTRKRVLPTTAQGVHEAFLRMRFSLGDSPATRERAKQMGFAPWSAWPDGSIDIESAVPDWAFVQDRRWRKAIRERYEK